MMHFRRYMLAAAMLCLPPEIGAAQGATETTDGLQIELNALQDVGEACRLTFVAQNLTGSEIEQAVFETVIFDASGGVVSLSLFDFRQLPSDRPRVRQFDLPGILCDNVGRALINGSSTCTVAGMPSEVCDAGLVPSSRLDVELLG